MNIKSIQLYNSLHPQVSASQWSTYQAYVDSLFAELRSQTYNLRQLTAANQKLPSWVSDRQSLVWVKIDSHSQDHLELIPNTTISSPNEMVAYLKEKLELNLLAENCNFTTPTIESLWNKLVEHLVWIKTIGNPLIIWHLEANYLTITATSVQQVEQFTLS